MSEAMKRQSTERAKTDADAAKWPAFYQRLNEATGWRGETFEFRRNSTFANAFEDGFTLHGTHAVEFTMPDGSKRLVRPAPAEDTPC